VEGLVELFLLDPARLKLVTTPFQSGPYDWVTKVRKGSKTIQMLQAYDKVDLILILPLPISFLPEHGKPLHQDTTLHRDQALRSISFIDSLLVFQSIPEKEGFDRPVAYFSSKKNGVIYDFLIPSFRLQYSDT
jgi:hypothetical protein